jgi:glutathione S-transferase
MASGKMILYWGSGSAPCWRPMLVLAEKGLSDKCTSKRLEFSKGQHKETDILAINPRGQVDIILYLSFTCHKLGQW